MQLFKSILYSTKIKSIHASDQNSKREYTYYSMSDHNMQEKMPLIFLASESYLLKTSDSLILISQKMLFYVLCH